MELDSFDRDCFGIHLQNEDENALQVHSDDGSYGNWQDKTFYLRRRTNQLLILERTGRDRESISFILF